MQRSTALLLVFLAASGCVGDDEVEEQPTTSEPSTTPTSSENDSMEPLPTTNTLFFRRAPDMSVEPGTEASPETTPYSFGGGGFGGTPPRWEYRASAHAAPTDVEANVWIRVIEPLFVPPGQPGCVWSLEVYANDEFAFPVMCSGPTGPTVATGDYELRFSGGSPNQTSVAASTTWAFVMRRAAFSPTPNEAVVILTSSEDFPSRIEIGGLAEPKPAG